MTGQSGWMAQWAPLIDRVGDDLGDGPPRFGPDAVDPSAIRMFLEPLEFDCPLHYDADVARAYGHADITAPYMSAWTFTFPPVWSPGDPPAFGDAFRNTQPQRDIMFDADFPGAPATTSVFGTGVSIEFDRPLVVGERIGATSRRLIACVPKQTAVGRGAFVTFERTLVTRTMERVCRIEAQMYLYNPLTVAEDNVDE